MLLISFWNCLYVAILMNSASLLHAILLRGTGRAQRRLYSCTAVVHTLYIRAVGDLQSCVVLFLLKCKIFLFLFSEIFCHSLFCRSCEMWNSVVTPRDAGIQGPGWVAIPWGGVEGGEGKVISFYSRSVSSAAAAVRRDTNTPSAPKQNCKCWMVLFVQILVKSEIGLCIYLLHTHVLNIIKTRYTKRNECHLFIK